MRSDAVSHILGSTPPQNTERRRVPGRKSTGGPGQLPLRCIGSSGLRDGRIRACAAICLPGGPTGESYTSLRGPLNLEGKPLLVDEKGPCDTPISGNERLKVTMESTKIWLVAYLPAGLVSAEQAERHLIDLLKEAPVAEMLISGHSAE